MSAPHIEDVAREIIRLDEKAKAARTLIEQMDIGFELHPKLADAPRLARAYLELLRAATHVADELRDNVSPGTRWPDNIYFAQLEGVLRDPNTLIAQSLAREEG